MDKEALRLDYETKKHKATRFISSVKEQLNVLITSNDITLGTPLESRIKSIQSIEEKLVRKNKTIGSVVELDDFIGLRIIVLFKSDLDKIHQLIKKNFDVGEEENVAGRLRDDQFGYQSTHFAISLPKQWLTVPAMTDLGGLKAELQVRTLSQHIWAVASHKLQYKQENNVPTTLRRSINRVSALLETVDLEFERVLQERTEYREELQHTTYESEFNVDVLEALCDEYLPKANKDEGNEEFSTIFKQLVENNINSKERFIALIKDNMEFVLKEEAKNIDRILRDREDLDANFDNNEDSYKNEILNEVSRANRGVFYSHVGLVRRCLYWKFPNLSRITHSRKHTK